MELLLVDKIEGLGTALVHWDTDQALCANQAVEKCVGEVALSPSERKGGRCGKLCKGTVRVDETEAGQTELKAAR